VDRVLYAMDYPYQFEAREVAEMDAVGTELERRKFYELNARAVFQLSRLSPAGVKQSVCLKS
jgi:2,3-dihydroxybenzoate decarboxylase